MEVTGGAQGFFVVIIGYIWKSGSLSVNKGRESWGFLEKQAKNIVCENGLCI